MTDWERASFPPLSFCPKICFHELLKTQSSSFNAGLDNGVGSQAWLIKPHPVLVLVLHWQFHYVAIDWQIEPPESIFTNFLCEEQDNMKGRYQIAFKFVYFWCCYRYDWREMFLKRPHLRFEGLYVSRNTYIHTGITEWRIKNPVHLVTYFRYIRFFPNGTLLQRTSPEVILCNFLLQKFPASLMPHAVWNILLLNQLMHILESTIGLVMNQIFSLSEAKSFEEKRSRPFDYLEPSL